MTITNQISRRFFSLERASFGVNKTFRWNIYAEKQYKSFSWLRWARKKYKRKPDATIFELFK